MKKTSSDDNESDHSLAPDDLKLFNRILSLEMS